MSEPKDMRTPDEIIAARKSKQKAKINRLLVGVALFVGVPAVIAVVFFSSRSTNDNAVQTELTRVYSESELAEARDNFQQALTSFENTYSAKLNDPALSQWRANQYAEIERIKSQALNAYAKSAFIQAQLHLSAWQQAAITLIADWEQTHQQALQTAQTWFEQGDIAKAQVALNRANDIMPNSADNKAMAARIAAFGQIEVLLQSLAVARTENNLEKQLRISKQIFALDPSRTELKIQIANLQNTLDEAALSALFTKAEMALQNKQLAQAATLLSQAKRIRPDSVGAKRLAQRLNELQQQASLQSIKNMLDALKIEQDWQGVAALSNQGLQTYQNDDELQNSSEQAKQILMVQRNVQQILAQSERLADPDIREYATSILAQSLGYLSLSSSLATQVKTLSDAIQLYATPVAVTILSDGETDISVIGQGQVGKAQQRTIELTPGKYIIQGQKTGFRTKRVNIEVENNKPMQITVISDEAI